MKYGESAFDILYLLTAVIIGALILIKAKNRTERMMGAACLILGCGDAFHLVPRVLNYFADGDFTAALGIGKLVTSVTMTVFYIFMYHIAEDVFRFGKQPKLRAAVYILSALRVIVCLFPQNGWLTNESGMLWGILRNIPFTALGVIIIVIWFKNREKTRRFRLIWLWVLLSFAFYIPVTVFAGVVPMLGMLMLPKTICYVAMIVTFLRAVTGGAK